MSTPNQQEPILLKDRFTDLAEEILTEARHAAALRDGLDREIATEAERETADVTEQDALDGEQARLERDLETIQRRLSEIKPQLEEIRERRAGRAQWVAQRRVLRESAAAETERLEADGRQAYAVAEQVPDGAEQVQEDSVLPPGVVPVEPEFGSPLATVRDPLPPVEQDGSQPS